MLKFASLLKMKMTAMNFLVTRMAAHPEQMDFADLCKVSAEGANALLEAEPIESGHLSVYGGLRNHWSDILGCGLTHLDAENQILQYAFQDKGEQILLSLTLGDQFTLST